MTRGQSVAGRDLTLRYHGCDGSRDLYRQWTFSWLKHDRVTVG